MLELLVKHKDLRDAAQALIDRANEKGGPDNITVVMCRWMGEA
jgi:serine/threonine protein phosphatase PrpC